MVAETTQQPATLGASVLGGMSVLGQLLRHHQPAPVPVGGLRSYGWPPDTSSVTPVCEGGLLQTKRNETNSSNETNETNVGNTQGETLGGGITVLWLLAGYILGRSRV